MMLKLYLLFLCINLGFFIMDGMAGFSSVPVDVETMPKIANYTVTNDRTYLVGNLTNARNSTSGTLWNWFTESSERIFFSAEVFYNIVTGGFIINVIANAETSLGFTWPANLEVGLQPIIGLLHAIWLGYMILGRSSSGLT